MGSLGQASSSRAFFARAFLAAALLGGLALGGCGRRGPLELPPGTPTPMAENTTALADKQATLFDNAPPGVIQSPDQVVQVNRSSADLAAGKPERAINAPQATKTGSFLLDPLL